MRRNYSRLARVEEAKNLRATFLFGTLTIGILIAFVFLGLPTVAKFAGFLSDLGSSNKPIERDDMVPPPPPEVEELPEFTNQKELTVSGTTESAATAKIYVNGDPTEVVADKNGRIRVAVTLRSGENIIYGTSTDQSGNTSGDGAKFSVIFDDTAPDLEITSPTDGATYSASQKEIEITGKTESEVTLTINDRAVTVAEDGTFKTKLTLSDGSNQINFKAADRAGNTKELSLTVTYTP